MTRKWEMQKIDTYVSARTIENTRFLKPTRVEVKSGSRIQYTETHWIQSIRNNSVKNGMKTIALILVIVLLMPLSSCGAKNVVAQDGTMLPFGSGGNLIWKASDINYVYVFYELERTSADVVVAEFPEGSDGKSGFVNALNKPNKELVKTGISDENQHRSPFSEAARFDEDEIYFLSITHGYEYTLASIFRKDDGGYLWFQMRNESAEGDFPRVGFFHNSLYRISPDDMKKLEQYFEGLNKVSNPTG